MNWSNIFEATLSAFFGVNAMYYAIAAIGLNVQFGYTGLLNFGQAGFMACGAYGLGMTAHYFQISFWWGIAIGIGYAVVLGLIMGVPTLRLRADYLASRGLAASTPWFGCNACQDFATPAGDFAETYAQWQRGTAESRSRLAAPATPGQLAELGTRFFS